MEIMFYISRMNSINRDTGVLTVDPESSLVMKVSNVVENVTKSLLENVITKRARTTTTTTII